MEHRKFFFNFYVFKILIIRQLKKKQVLKNVVKYGILNTPQNSSKRYHFTAI